MIVVTSGIGSGTFVDGKLVGPAVGMTLVATDRIASLMSGPTV